MRSVVKVFRCSMAENIRSTTMTSNPNELESKFVHHFYREIAQHFSDTRHKPWPKVAEFLTKLPRGSLVADVGCGNGKNLQVTPNSFVIGSDNCLELLNIAGDRGGEVGLADCLNLPYRSGVFDSTISIAVIHHLSTEERRIRALQELCRITKPGGSILVYVWAFEQDNKKFDAQDVMVPWHLQPKYQSAVKSTEHDAPSSNSPKEEHLQKLGYRTYQRYYHVFKKGELRELFTLAGQPVTVTDDYYDHENWCAIAVKHTVSPNRTGNDR